MKPWVTRRAPAGLVVAAVWVAASLAGCDGRLPGESLPPPDDPHYADAWIAGQVRARLEADPQLGRYLIHVQSDNAVVCLQGTVPEAALRAQAEELAARTPHVHAVHNNIAIAPMPPRRAASTLGWARIARGRWRA